jgi:UDP-N-acetylmuramoyl-tripeptide--D-alanyl-D-alanine ligase
VENTPMFLAEEIVHATSGKMIQGQRNTGVYSVSIDSRKCEKNSLFVPLPGTNTDGHCFIHDAVKKGAAALFVSMEFFEKNREKILSLEPVIILVKDTLKALQLLALRYLNKLKGIIKVAVTGSNGKTTTKEIIGNILAEEAPTVVNEGNYNSEIGLPLSVFRARKNHRFAVFEMGMNHAGEIEELASIVKPDYALITNIGRAHIQQLGSKLNIAKEKKNIFKYFKGPEKGFLYEKEEFYDFLKQGVNGEIIPFGPEKTKGFKRSEDLGLIGSTIYWEGLQIHFPLFGFHNLLNALGAITLTKEMEIRPENIKKGLEKVKPLFGRSQVFNNHITIIQDCYNSNPESAKTVLEYVEILVRKGRKIAVLGSMLELGDESNRAHKELALFALKLHLDAYFFFGAEMEDAYEVFRQNDYKGIYKWTNNFSTLLKDVKKTVKKGDLILLKGSRGMALERLVESLLSN